MEGCVKESRLSEISTADLLNELASRSGVEKISVGSVRLRRKYGGDSLERAIYSVKEVVELTGLSKSMVYELMRIGEMPSVHLSERRKGVPRKELEEWLRSRTRKVV